MVHFPNHLGLAPQAITYRASGTKNAKTKSLTALGRGHRREAEVYVRLSAPKPTVYKPDVLLRVAAHKPHFYRDLNPLRRCPPG